MKVYVVVPVFGRLELTKRFFTSLSKQVKNLVFIVVDDDEKNYDNFDYFSNLNLSNVVSLKTEGNQWWCGTTRVGLNWIFNNKDILDEDVVIIANNDVSLPPGQFAKISPYIADGVFVHPKTFADSGEELSSGCKVKSWFPFVTNHPKGGQKEKEPIDLCTARFLCMKYSTLKVVGNISLNLVQYHGDYDFSLRAKNKGVKSFILGNAYCNVFDGDTGLKSSNQLSLKELYESFYSIRSANNLKSRFKFLKNNFSVFASIFILMSMVFNMFLKVFYYKIVNAFKG